MYITIPTVPAYPNKTSLVTAAESIEDSQTPPVPSEPAPSVQESVSTSKDASIKIPTQDPSPVQPARTPVEQPDPVKSDPVKPDPVKKLPLAKAKSVAKAVVDNQPPPVVPSKPKKTQKKSTPPASKASHQAKAQKKANASSTKETFDTGTSVEPDARDHRRG